MSLARRGILVPMYLVDNYQLAFSDYGFFFSPSAESSALRRRFENSLMRHPRVVWLARMSGTFQYGATFMAKRPHELVDFFSWMQPLSQGAYARKATRIAVDCTWFSPNYLAPDVTERITVSITSSAEPPVLDAIDKKILITMTENPASSTTQLASLAGMNKSSLAYRIGRLREAKIIRGRMYSIKNYILGILMYRVMIVDCGLTDAQRRQLYEICSRCPHVVAFVVCTGNWDFEFRFEAEHPEIVDNFCQQLIDTFGKSIGSVLVSQQLSTLKRSAYADDVQQQ
jgi:DNA-binding Lrp family transcriptional regulator